MVIVFCGTVVDYAGGSDGVEYDIKAAYIYNFIRFTKWDEDYSATNKTALVIGIIGKNPFGSHAFDSVKDKPIPGKNRNL
jgi:hypothetical protein